MKNKKVLILAVLLVAVLLAASLGYDELKAQVEPQSMVTVATAAPAEPETEVTTQSAPEATSPEDSSQAETEQPPAPDLTVYDSEGNAVSLSDLRGKPVIINFWATWCGYCVQEMPDFQTVYEEYGDEIHFMMINVTDGYQETKEDAAAFIVEKGFTFPVYYDLDLSAANAYYVNAMPVTYLLDENGMFVAWQQGALNEQLLRSGVSMLLETQ